VLSSDFALNPLQITGEKAGSDLAATKISGKFLNARSAAQRVKGRRPGIVTQKNAYICF
jgi:hypothetical protein